MRMGGPKGLLTWPDGTRWITKAVTMLRDGGCSEVVVIVGSGADEMGALAADANATVIHAAYWRWGISQSLAAGLNHLQGGQVGAALVHLVDLPDVGEKVVARVLASAELSDQVLARAVYGGRPGHPVLLGRAHWVALMSSASEDGGARVYLSTHEPASIECGDLATGTDVDTRDAFARWRIELQV